MTKNRECAKADQEALALADRLLVLAEGHSASCDTDECAVLDSVLRECAYKIRAATQGRSGSAIEQGKDRSPDEEPAWTDLKR